MWSAQRISVQSDIRGSVLMSRDGLDLQQVLAIASILMDVPLSNIKLTTLDILYFSRRRQSLLIKAELIPLSTHARQNSSSIERNHSLEGKFHLLFL